jgi:hypothetical protein
MRQGTPAPISFDQAEMVRPGHGRPNRAYLGWDAEVAPRPAPEGVQVRKTDARVQDPLVLDEIEMYGDLVIAASGSEQRLSQEEIDRVLGLRPDTPAHD